MFSENTWSRWEKSTKLIFNFTKLKIFIVMVSVTIISVYQFHGIGHSFNSKTEQKQLLVPWMFDLITHCLFSFNSCDHTRVTAPAVRAVTTWRSTLTSSQLWRFSHSQKMTCGKFPNCSQPFFTWAMWTLRVKQSLKMKIILKQVQSFK